jgi:hypothetical protein
MTDLERLEAELERQDRDLAACFDEMRALDPETVIGVSPEWMRELAADAAPIQVPMPWALRA